MSLLTMIRSLADSIFQRRALEREMDEELRSHIQHRADDLARSGISRGEAERRARIEFGGYEHFKEECRESLGVHFLETVIQDLRFSMRLLRKSPAFTAIAVLTLALGIGANTAIFSLIDTVVLRFLPVQRPQELIEVLRLNPRDKTPTSGFTYALWEQFRDQQDIFSSVFAWSTERLDLARGGEVHYATGVFTSGSYFPTLGVRPALGRLFTPADDQRGCVSRAVLSYGFWQEHYGGAQNALGSVISLSNHPFEIIGVSAPGFHGMEVGSRFDVAVPICARDVFDGKEKRLDTRDSWWLRMAGRLKAGIRPEQVDARLKLLSPGVWGGAVPLTWEPEWQENFRKRLLISAPAATGISELREQFERPLTILMAVVGLVLLIASANLASLMLARATSRAKEMAIRKALGASRARLVRQLLVESLLLAFAGAAVGILFARWGAALLVRFISTGANAVFLDLTPDGRMLGFTAAIAMLTAVLFGVLPALRSSKVPVTAAMKGSHAHAGDPSLRLRSEKWIVAAQVACSVVLLVVSGLFLRTLNKLVVLDLGFDRSNVLLVNANLRPANIPSGEHQVILADIESRLRAIPGVLSVAQSSRVPISNDESAGPLLVDRPNAPKGPDAVVWMNHISPGYFATMREPLLAGRNFDSTDTATSAPVAIVNEAFARKFLPGMNVVGTVVHRLEGRAGVPPTAIRIVGLVKDAKYESVRESTFSQAFFPVAQIPAIEDFDAQYFELRTAAHSSAVTSLVQSSVAQVNKSISLEFSSLTQQVDDSLVQERLLATLSTFFGALALLLAMIGLYGAVSYGVTQRRSEFGIRIALGAAPGSILRLVMRDVAVILLSGALGGVAISLLAVRLIQKFLFGLTPDDPATFLAAVVLLAAVALAAAYFPARRAMGVDPMV
ncbi:MAG TPA: ABC transporter permease, partial [Candidatus Angelobacter sp.]|nr:ABC transporter permease [Candidatus Angelobacter sp.]